MVQLLFARLPQFKDDKLSNYLNKSPQEHHSISSQQEIISVEISSNFCNTDLFSPSHIKMFVFSSIFLDSNSLQVENTVNSISSNSLSTWISLTLK